MESHKSDINTKMSIPLSVQRSTMSSSKSNASASKNAVIDLGLVVNTSTEVEIIGEPNEIESDETNRKGGDDITGFSYSRWCW